MFATVPDTQGAAMDEMLTTKYYSQLMRLPILQNITNTNRFNLYGQIYQAVVDLDFDLLDEMYEAAQKLNNDLFADLSKIIDMVNDRQVEGLRDLLEEAQYHFGSSWRDMEGLFDKGTIALRDAILLDLKEAVCLLIEAGVGINELCRIKNSNHNQVSSMLTHAVRSANPSMLEFIIGKGADVDSKEAEFAIITAIEMNDVVMTEILLKHGARVEGDLLYETFLQHAIGKNTVEMIELLIRYGGNVSNAFKWIQDHPHQFNSSPVINQKLIKTLLDYSVDINLQQLPDLTSIDIAGFNFLRVAVQGKSVSQEMLAPFKGANSAITFDNCCGNYSTKQNVIRLLPLWHVAAQGNTAAVAEKLALGADVNQPGRDTNGLQYAPIVLAAKKGHLRIVQLLAGHLAINRTSIEIALRVADNCQQNEVADFLMGELARLALGNDSLMKELIRQRNYMHKKISTNYPDSNLSANFNVNNNNNINKTEHDNLPELLSECQQWMSENSGDSNHNHLLLDWLATEGHYYIENYAQFSRLALELSKCGYTTNPSPATIEYDAIMLNVNNLEFKMDLALK